MNDDQKEVAIKLAAALAFLGLSLVLIYGWQPGSVFLLFMSGMFILVAKTDDGEDK